jgi:Sigma-70 factor, region 1.1
VERLIATNATPQKKEAPKKEGPETPPDSPPLDLSDAAVKKLIRSANYVTHDQINSVLPSEKVNSEQIEDVLADVVETEEATADEERQREEPDEEPESKGGELVVVQPSWSWSSKGCQPSPRPRSRPSAPTIPSACICVKWARWNCCRARARSPSPSASRLAARR